MKTPRFELKDFRLNEILSMLTPYSGPSLSEELNRVWTGEAGPSNSAIAFLSISPPKTSRKTRSFVRTNGTQRSLGTSPKTST